MSGDLPTVTVTGNAVADPQIRFTASGKAWCSLRVACTERRKDGDTWVNGEATFIHLLAYGSTAENVTESIRKGQRVIAVGRLRVREYDGKDGGKRTATEVLCDDLGPSLKWARASVNRAPSPAPAAAGPVESDPWAAGGAS